jgi:hypothetical protein
MVRAFLPKAALLLAFILLLATPVVQAAEPGAHKSPAVGIVPDLFSQAWGFLTRIWADNGCRIDPNGRCVAEPLATPEADNGCGIDPDGRCTH